MSKQQENAGCALGWLKNLLGIDGNQKQGKKDLAPPSIMVSKKFFTSAEQSFYRVLQQCVDGRMDIFVQVSLRQLFFLKGKGQQAWQNKIQSRSVDFLLCDAQTLTPVLGIELDDVSHDAADRIARDAEVDLIFGAAGLPLLHVKAAKQYDPRALVNEIQASINNKNKVR